MNCGANRSANVWISEFAGTPDVVERTGERIREWFRRSNPAVQNGDVRIRLDERIRERARIARDMHDTLLQGFLGVSLQLQAAVEQLPAGSPGKPALDSAAVRMRLVINEARDILQGLRSSAIEAMSLEQALSCLREEFTPGGGIKFRVFVTGKPRVLKPEIQEQIYFIGREALINALRHSNATSIEAEIEYLPRRMRVLIRDNGCGMNPQVATRGRNSHWGLVGMRERADGIGAQFRIWSRAGAGTEVELSLPGRALAEACAQTEA